MKEYTEVWFPRVSKVAAVVVISDSPAWPSDHLIDELQRLRKDEGVLNTVRRDYPGLVIATFSPKRGAFTAVEPFEDHSGPVDDHKDGGGKNGTLALTSHGTFLGTSPELSPQQQLSEQELTALWDEFRMSAT